MCIKSILVIFSVAVAATAYADIVEPEVLHRIGYEVLVAAAGAAAFGGGLIRRLRNDSKNDKKEHWKDEFEVSPADSNAHQASVHSRCGHYLALCRRWTLAVVVS